MVILNETNKQKQGERVLGNLAHEDANKSPILCCSGLSGGLEEKEKMTKPITTSSSKTGTENRK